MCTIHYERGQLPRIEHSFLCIMQYLLAKTFYKNENLLPPSLPFNLFQPLSTPFNMVQSVSHCLFGQQQRQNVQKKATRECIRDLKLHTYYLWNSVNLVSRTFGIPANVDGTVVSRVFGKHLGNDWEVTFNFEQRKIVVENRSRKENCRNFFTYNKVDGNKEIRSKKDIHGELELEIDLISFT